MSLEQTSKDLSGLMAKAAEMVDLVAGFRSTADPLHHRLHHLT